MKDLSIQKLSFVILSSLILLISCTEEPDHVDFDCGMVETQITKLDHSVGAYIDSNFTNSSSSIFEEAAIGIYIEDFRITTETETNCFAFTAVPQLIEKIEVTSSNSITSGGAEFASSEDLSGLFKLHNKSQTYSISEFINAQKNDPLIFHSDEDEFALQLLNKPDITIDQSFEIQITFDDSEVLNIVISNFKVTD